MTQITEYGAVDEPFSWDDVGLVLDPTDDVNPADYGFTEDGLARALVVHRGHDIRYCPQRGKWLRWDAHRWAWDEGGAHREFAKTIARRLPEENKNQTLFKRRALSAAGIGGVVKLAESDPAVVVPYDKLDADPWALNTPGGVVDLRTGTLGSVDRNGNHTRSTSCTPDPDADPTRWLEFLKVTFGGDDELIGYLQRLVGYSAVGLVGPHVLPFCFGSGGNGKGVFLEAVAGVLGDYATTASGQFLMAQRHTGHETEIARLAGARMVICSEVNEEDRFDEARVKQLTGGDTLTARFMRQDHFTFTPTHQLWLMGNHQPAVRSGGRSFWRRLRLVPFAHEVPEDDIVDDLQGIFVRDHGPSLLAWIAAGAADYAQGGLREPERVKAATSAYALDQDTVGRFVDECCTKTTSNQNQVKTSVVREAYESWCHGLGEAPVSAKALSMALTRMGVTLEKGTKGVRFYGGLVLDEPVDDEPNEGRWTER